MKKFILSLVVVCIGIISSSKAQTQQGNVLIGADLGQFSLQLNSPHAFSASITPEAAWFVKDNLAVGGFADLGLLTSSGFTTVTYGLGPMVRYYFGKSTNTASHGQFFAEAHAGVNGYSESNQPSSGALTFGGGYGFAYFLTPNVGLETVLAYNGSQGLGNNLGYGHVVQLNVGLQVYLEGKKSKK